MSRPRDGKMSGLDWLSARRRHGDANGRASGRRVLISERKREPVVEQFRLLRTRIEVAGPSAIMVTSALDQEGKTFCAVNLAIALSMSAGVSVVLVDSDLRHPTVASHFDLDPVPGLVDCLRNSDRWQDCLRPTKHDRLQVLPAGHASDSAPELLDSERMAVLVKQIKAELPAHYLIFDAPPLLLTADPALIARHVDNALLVVRACATPKAAVLKAVESLGSDRFLGVIFNDATMQASQYYYYGRSYGRYPYGGDRAERLP